MGRYFGQRNICPGFSPVQLIANLRWGAETKIVSSEGVGFEV